MKLRALSRGLLLLGLLAAAALIACSDDEDVAGPGGDAFEDVSTVIVDEFGVLRAAFAPPSGSPTCLIVSPAPPFPDGDGDGVPDSVRCVFDPAGCSFGDDTYTATTSGLIVLTDPGAAFGFRARLEDLAYTMTSGDPSITRQRVLNGVRVVTGAPDSLALSRHDTLTFSRTGGATATVIEALTGTFTPEAGQTVSFGVGVPPPPGQYTVTGTITWTQGTSVYVLDVTTASPLLYPSGCDSPFPSGGELRFHLTSGGPAGTLTVAWDGCWNDAVTDWIPD